VTAAAEVEDDVVRHLLPAEADGELGERVPCVGEAGRLGGVDEAGQEEAFAAAVGKVDELPEERVDEVALPMCDAELMQSVFGRNSPLEGAGEHGPAVRIGLDHDDAAAGRERPGQQEGERGGGGTG